MNTDHIEKALGSYKHFIGVFPMDKVKKHLSKKYSKLKGVVMNLDPSWLEGSHWVGIMIKPSVTYKRITIEYFDSYGRVPPILTNEKYKIVHNTQRFQKYYTTTCGQFCIYVIQQRLKGKSYKRILQALKSKKDPDNFVRNYVNTNFSNLTKHLCKNIAKNTQCCRDFCPNPPCRKIKNLKLF